MFIKNFGNNLFGALLDNLGLKTSRSQMTDQIIDELIFNSLKGKKYFEAICLTEPIAIQQKSMVLGTGVYYPVRVRPLDIYNFVIPDPCSFDEPDDIARAIQSHPIAFAIRPEGHGERLPTFGDTIRCHFSIGGPNNSGAIRGLRYDMPQKNHKFDYQCAKKILRAQKLFGTGRVKLLSLPNPAPPPVPKPVRRLGGRWLPDLNCDDAYDSCKERVKDFVKNQLGRVPVKSDYDDCERAYDRCLTLEIEKEKAKKENESLYYYDRSAYRNIKGFERWVDWNNRMGNLPKFVMHGVDLAYTSTGDTTNFPPRVSAKWPMTHRTNYCSSTLIDEPDKRFLNVERPYALPIKSDEKFKTFDLGASGHSYRDIDRIYLRTMVLRALPFVRGYNYPYNSTEFMEHLIMYPEAALHWEIQKDHSCVECVAAAEIFLDSRGDLAQLTKKAKDPLLGVIPNYEKYLYEPDSTIPDPKKYTIQSGDYLGRIAQKTGVSVSNLMKWNNLTSDLIFAGRKLIIEDPSADKFQAKGNKNAIIMLGQSDSDHRPCD